MIIPNITPLPPSPQRTDPATFAARADASLTAQETVFTPELNAFASAVNVTQAEMTVLSATATTQAQIATTQAAAAASSALSAGATVWVSGTTYTVGVSRYSPLNGQVYRRMVGGAGTTDPSLDAVNWRVVNGLTSELIDLPFNNLPSIRPSLNLDFANNQAVDPRITFTRASTATRVNNKGLIESVASGVPRIDYNPVTLVCNGLLIEEQRTNLWNYSEAINDASWTTTNTTVVANAITAPDGLVSADSLTVTTDYSRVGKNITITSGDTVTISSFCKNISGGFIRLDLNSRPNVWFNITTGTITQDNGAGNDATTSYVAGSARITDFGNGWYRCSATITTSGVTTIGAWFSPCGASGSGSAIGNAAYFWGLSAEVGTFPTSYQPSTETWTGRAGTATFYGSNGLIQTASSGVARMNYNPANLTVQPKLLLEGAGTNLLTYSEAFDNAAWAKTRATVTANATTAPDGTLTADKLIEDTTASSTHQIGVFLTKAASSVTYTASFFIKAGERSAIRFNANTGAQGFTADLDLVAQTATPSVYGSGFSSGGASIVAIGGGWFRVSMAFTTDAGTSLEYRKQIISGGVASYTGDGTSGLFIWGAQLEAGAFPTSYIPTVASQVTRVADTSTSAQTTRAADVASMTGANFSSWYRQDEGSFVCSSDLVALSGSYPALCSVNDGDANEQISLVHDTAAGYKRYLQVSNGGVTQAILNNAETLVANTMYVAAFAYKANDFGFSRSGEAAQTDAIGTVPTVNQLLIGWRPGPVYTSGHIRSLSYYPKRLTNAELQALSTQ